MLTKLFPFLNPAVIARDVPPKLRHLAADLDGLRRAPFVSALLETPHIDEWTAMLSPMGVRLIGRVTGHPLLGDRPGVTSPLWAADPEDRWVRTTSRFYRLGTPAEAAGRDVLRSVFNAHRSRDGDGSSEGRS
jgi:hypothetical protein